MFRRRDRAPLEELVAERARRREQYPVNFSRNFLTRREKRLVEEIKRVIGSNASSRTEVDLSIASVIVPERVDARGVLVKSTSLVWGAIVNELYRDWTRAYSIPPEKWEEIVAGAFSRAGFDVILTPRSRDHGRDVIATTKGVGCVKIIGSVKAYKPGNIVRYDEVRSLLGVMAGERDTSKGIISTTSAFPPRIMEDPFVAPFVPTRLELMDGDALRNWLVKLL
jgi:restriction system protein